MDAHVLVMDTLKGSIMLLVLSLGLRASPGSALSVLRKPALLARSLLSMVIVMPAVAILFAKVFHLKSPIEITLLAISLSPLPPLLPKWVRKTGVMEAYAIGLMVAAALASFILIPLAMSLIGRIFSVQISLPAAAIVPILLATVLAPLALGILLHSASPRISEKAAKYVGLAGMILLFVSFIPALIAMHKAIFSLFGNGTLLAFVAFSALGVLVGQWIGGPLPEYRSVLSTFTAMRHPAVAIVILEKSFPDETLVVPAVILYLLVSVLIATVFVGRPKRAGAGTPGHIPERGGQGLKPA